MKTKFLLVLLVCISLQVYSQVSIGPRHLGKSKKFKKGILDTFKKTETIFLLSNIYDKQTYEQVLKDSWDVTPYKIISIEDFNIEDYLSNRYSIVQLSGFKRTVTRVSTALSGSTLFTFVDLTMYKSKKIKEKLKNLPPKARKKQKQRIIDANTIKIARFYLYPKDTFLKTVFSEEMDQAVGAMYMKDVFFNYNPGFLKNYFQKINDQIKKEKIYWMYGDDYLPELKNLKNKTLYIPSYLGITYNALTGQDRSRDSKYIESLFKKYDYSYKIISEKALSAKIMHKEPIYYLRYTRVNAERFLQIVNAQTGEIVYRNYMIGVSYKIKSKHIKAINSKISKAAKK